MAPQSQVPTHLGGLLGGFFGSGARLTPFIRYPPRLQTDGSYGVSGELVVSHWGTD